MLGCLSVFTLTSHFHVESDWDLEDILNGKFDTTHAEPTMARIKGVILRAEFPAALVVVKKLLVNAGEMQVHSWVGEDSGEGNGNPSHCSCLGNLWTEDLWAIIYGVSKSRTWLNASTITKILTAMTKFMHRWAITTVSQLSDGWQQLWMYCTPLSFETGCICPRTLFSGNYGMAWLHQCHPGRVKAILLFSLQSRGYIASVKGGTT